MTADRGKWKGKHGRQEMMMNQYQLGIDSLYFDQVRTSNQTKAGNNKNLDRAQFTRSFIPIEESQYNEDAQYRCVFYKRSLTLGVSASYEQASHCFCALGSFLVILNSVTRLFIKKNKNHIPYSLLIQVPTHASGLAGIYIGRQNLKHYWQLGISRQHNI